MSSLLWQFPALYTDMTKNVINNTLRFIWIVYFAGAVREDLTQISREFAN